MSCEPEAAAASCVDYSTLRVQREYFCLLPRRLRFLPRVPFFVLLNWCLAAASLRHSKQMGLCCRRAKKKRQDLSGCSIRNNKRKEAVLAIVPTGRGRHTAANEVTPRRLNRHKKCPLMHNVPLSTFPCPPFRLLSRSPSAYSCVSRTILRQVLAGLCFGEKVVQTVASPVHNLTSAFGHLFTRGQ